MNVLMMCGCIFNSFLTIDNRINSFDYNLLGQENNKGALKIFKFKTEIYPDGFNTWYSYGECLLMLGEKAAAVKAYRKSLCPNSKNKGAETIIEKNKYESSTRYRII